MSQSDYDKRTALHLAACENHIDIVQFLIRVGKVKIDPRDRWDKTPYDEAVRLNHIEIINLLKPIDVVVEDKKIYVSSSGSNISSKKPPINKESISSRSSKRKIYSD